MRKNRQNRPKIRGFLRREAEEKLLPELFTESGGQNYRVEILQVNG